jgi:hypothetical protein
LDFSLSRCQRESTKIWRVHTGKRKKREYEANRWGSEERNSPIRAFFNSPAVVDTRIKEKESENQKKKKGKQTSKKAGFAGYKEKESENQKKKKGKQTSKKAGFAGYLDLKWICSNTMAEFAADPSSLLFCFFILFFFFLSLSLSSFIFYFFIIIVLFSV